MQKFQLRFCDNKGNGSFYYFETDKPTNIEAKACELATEMLKKERQRYRDTIFYKPFKPKRVVHVWEYDPVTKGPKKKGYRFKLHYKYTKVTYKGGQVNFDEWYACESE